MVKYLRLVPLFLISLTTAQIIPATGIAESCDENAAYNKMMALGRAQSRIIGSGGQAAQQTGMRITMDSASISELLAQKKFDEACAKYDAVAKKFGIDLAKESEGLVTMQELSKDGGKRGGICSQADAHIKMMNLHNQLQDKVALGDVDQDVIKRFNNDSTKFGELMYTDPSEMCRKLDTLKEKYKLN